LNSPLGIIGGLLQQLGENKIYLPNINLGPPQVINVTSNAVTKAKSVIRLIKVPVGGTIDLHFINGGEDGDLLIAFGTDVKLKRNVGNLAIDSDLTLEPGRSIVMYLDAGKWQELCRRA
jgi:hypothetical protein